ncbi:MAG: hypothetical protein K2X01_06305 [Cyanobacteria bacterium]|nr:hypothetical protein [Cyanobacteriota bacterium]
MSILNTGYTQLAARAAYSPRTSGPAGADPSRYAELSTGLANTVTGKETPEELVALNEIDKQLKLKLEKSKIQYEWQNGFNDWLLQISKKNVEQAQRRVDAGALG